ncbi:MAG: hypothetical protein HOP19_28635 [Acidobacteria bacterium]|nr:hypothetical protein [Acidobacteriota bacterium]
MAYPFNRLEFEQKKVAGLFNPQFNYEDYLQLIREQEEIKREAEVKAEREGYELGAPQLDLTPEDEAILDRVWAKRATEAVAMAQPSTILPPATNWLDRISGSFKDEPAFEQVLELGRAARAAQRYYPAEPESQENDLAVSTGPIGATA